MTGDSPFFSTTTARLRRSSVNQRKPCSPIQRGRWYVPWRHGVTKVTRALNEVVARHSELRTITGKKVFELQPNIDWNKGRAVLWLLETLGLEQPEVLPLYIGDDLTDEDAFRALRQRGVGIVVSELPRPTAARYALRSPGGVERFLREIVAGLL